MSKKKKRSLEDNGNSFYEEYEPFINSALDFIPGIGAINRVIKKDYKQAIKNAIYDIAPVSFINKAIDKLPISSKDRIKLADNIHTANAMDNIKQAIKVALYGDKVYDDYVYDYNSSENDRHKQRLEDPGNAFLLTDKEQEKFMNNLGYKKTNDDDGIKMIKKATDALTKYRLGRKPNIYQLGEDVIPRDSVIPVPLDSIPADYKGAYGGFGNKELKYKLIHAGNHPTIYYKHKNPKKKEYYYRDIDLNDYGKHHDTKGTTYDNIQILANMYDFIGNPFIQKTGIQRLLTEEELDKAWGLTE